MTIDLESLRGFTPGPWRLSGVDVVNGDDHWCINGHALVEGFHSPTDCRLATVYTIEANARLIAAAPSMHAELTTRRARDAEAVRRQDMTTNDKLADALRNLIRAGKHLRNTVVETRGVAGMDDHDVAISDSIAALAEHDAQPAPAPVQVGGLEGDARLAHDQCRAVAQMARALAEVHDARMSILATGRAPVEVIGQSSAEIMEWLGDALSGMDACDESDEWMDPVFDAAQARWPIASQQESRNAD
ncbi:MAG: hypothetical protein QG616_2078 [Pseudomonadota bacterium]|nr:hypothetical protein [Pseudomonadota bacterium]